MLFMCNAVFAATLSEVYLSEKEQEATFDYLLDVKIQQDYEGDWRIEDNHPHRYAQYQKAVRRIEELVREERGWQAILPMLRSMGDGVKDLATEFGWKRDTTSFFNVDYPWVAPIIHHKGDLIINQSIELDYPLLVEGNLRVNGNLVLRNRAVPMVVTGDLEARNLLYGLMMNDEEEHLFVKGKVRLTGYAFMEGRTKTFDHDLSANQVFSLFTSEPNEFSDTHLENNGHNNERNQPRLHAFPDDPALVRPSILPWSGEVDFDLLAQYLQHGHEPFAYSHRDKQPQHPWDQFFDAWVKRADASWVYPEIIGAKMVSMKRDDFSKKNRKPLKEAGFNYIDVLGDLRTGRGFLIYQNDLFPDNYIEDPDAFEKMFGKPPLNTYQTMSPDQYPSMKQLFLRYERSDFNKLLSGDIVDASYSSYYNNGLGEEHEIQTLFIKEKPFLDKDPYLAIFWLLHFGLIFDERYHEVLELAEKQSNPLLSSAISFFEQGGYEQVSAYSGRLFEIDPILTDGGQLRVPSGKEVFQQFHSDYIYAYYSKNQIRNANTISALLYAIEHDFMGNNALEKAELLVKTAQKNNLWSVVSIPDKPRINKLAWRYVLLYSPDVDISDKQRADWKAAIDNYHAKQNPRPVRFWEEIGIKNPNTEEEKAKFIAQLLVGDYSDALKQLQANKNGDTLLHEITYEVMEYIDNHSDKKLKVDSDTLLFFIDWAIENQIAEYYLRSVLSQLAIHESLKLSTWIDKKLNKPRLRWATTHDENGRLDSIVNIIKILKEYSSQAPVYEYE
jgi:hypothetical protein